MSNRYRRLLERGWLPALLLLAAVALAAHSLLLLIAALAALVVGALAQAWRRFGLRRVSYERHFEETRLFPGEETTLHLLVTNRKLLPLPWLSAAETFSAGLRPLDGRARHSDLRQFAVRQSFTLGPFEQVEREVRLRAERRGCYLFPPVAAAAGDPFGFYRAEGTLGRRDEALVYPELLERAAYTIRAQQPFGEVKAARPVWADPAKLAGVRNYAPGDPLRHLHWRATARLGRLQTRRFDPGAGLQLVLVLDVNTAAEAWHGVDHALLERAVSVVASIARDALEDGIPVGLLANALTVNSDQHIRLRPGQAPDQLAALLEELARLVPYFGPPVADILERELPRLPFGAALLLVSALDAPDTAAVLEAARRRGHPVLRCDPRDVAADEPAREPAWAR